MQIEGGSPFLISTNGECAPHLLNKTVAADICSTRESIDKLQKWLGSTALNPKKIIEEAKAKSGCESESCLYTRVPTLDKKDLEIRFTPRGPWNSTQWLSNDNIDDVLAAYNVKFPRFKHIEFQMRDFKAVGDELGKLDWCDLAKNYDCLGCVLNTDVTGGPGEHWTAFFVDFIRGTVEYFDSAAQTPHAEFTDLIVTTAHGLSECSGKKFVDEAVVQLEHQKENTECGVYSLYYIISRIHGVPFSRFRKSRVPDSDMILFRQFLFRHL